ncbi:DUF2461 domain-containing protein [Sporichthya polymorpha]|uniref:DUF2461 domain-containing protein n=1 Tax=Sporichthya polymorpha TaxID=35751 RepID=UPI00036F2F36|nr:DUF2461 domain-containing protein [Sporichthya polymorpha]
MTFDGIPTAALDFYDDLEADNSKTFWTAHKHVYEESVRAPMEALAAALAKEFGEGKLFRPYRDVRFSKDKTPYKTHQGVWFEESRVYVQVSAAGLFVAAGYWRTETSQVARLRRAVDHDLHGPALEAAIAKVTKKGFRIGGNQLARVPKGYDKEHPRADLLRYKTLTVAKELGFPDWLSTPQAKAQVAKEWRAMAPLVEWLDRHVGPA